MSVRTGDRTEGKITAVDASRLLIDYTYDRVHDKTLPKSDRWLMSKTIWDDAANARAKLLRGNAIRVESREDAEARFLLYEQEQARQGEAETPQIAWQRSRRKSSRRYGRKFSTIMDCKCKPW